MRTSTLRPGLAALATLALLLAGASSAQAQVSVQVTEIRASRGEAYVDPRLEPIRDHLKDYSYTRWEVVRQTPKSGRYGEELAFPIGGGMRVTVRPEKVERGSGFDIELDCVVWRRDERVASARVQVPNGGTHVIGLPASRDERTFVAVTARQR